MKNMGRITASKGWAVPVVVKNDYVYVHENITESEGEEGTVYSMDEIRYTHQEYFELLGKENATLKDELTTTQLALVDVYELIGG